MKKEEENEKERNIPPEYNSFYYYCGTKTDIWDIIGIGIMYPLLTFALLIYLTGRVWNLLAIFIVMDTVIFSSWAYLSKKEKKLEELYGTRQERARKKRLESLRQRLKEIEELEELERLEKAEKEEQL